MTVVAFAVTGLVAGAVAFVAGMATHARRHAQSTQNLADCWEHDLGEAVDRAAAAEGNRDALAAGLRDLLAEWGRLGTTGSLSLAAVQVRERVGHLLAPVRHEQVLARALAAEAAAVVLPDSSDAAGRVMRAVNAFDLHDVFPEDPA